MKELANRVLAAGEFQMGTAGTEFCSNEEMLFNLNSALAEMHDLLADVFQDYFIAKANLVVDGNGGTQDSAMLPEDFQRCLKVFYVTGTSRTPVDRFMLDDLSTLNDYPIFSIGSGAGYKYRIMGEEVHFIPTPPAGSAAEFELWYVPRYQYLEDWADRIHISVPVSWTDYVVYDVVARLLAKEESDPSYFLAKREECRQRFIAAATQRDAGRPQRMTEVSIPSYEDILP
jgi:hypothetical protein